MLFFEREKNESRSILLFGACYLVFFWIISKTVERLNELISEYKLPIAISLVGLVLIIGGIFSSNLSNFSSFNLKPSPKAFPKESLVDAKQFSEIKVDISGAIYKPGVYTLPKDSRVEDLIKESRGFLNSVNKEFVAKTLNLSQKLTDGMKIYIPSEGEQAVLAANSKGSTTNTSSLIGLNTATESELNSLPNIGPVSAKKIIDNRPYSDISELLSKKVLGKSTFEKIKDLVDLN